MKVRTASLRGRLDEPGLMTSQPLTRVVLTRTSLVHSFTNSYCQSASTGIYSVPSLAPLQKGEPSRDGGRRLRGSLASAFLPDVRCQMSDVRMAEYRHLTSGI